MKSRIPQTKWSTPPIQAIRSPVLPKRSSLCWAGFWIKIGGLAASWRWVSRSRSLSSIPCRSVWSSSIWRWVVSLNCWSSLSSKRTRSSGKIVKSGVKGGKSSSVHLRWSLPVKASGVSPVKNRSWSSSHLPRKIGIRCEVSKTKSCSQFKVHESMAVKWKKKRSEGVATIEVKTRQFGVNVPEVQSWSFLKFQKNEVTKPQQNQTKTKWSVPWLSTRSV